MSSPDIARGAERGKRILMIENAILGGRRVFAPMIGGWAETLHASALLIDEDGSIASPDNSAKVGGERFDLLRRTPAIAPEQDETPRIGPLNELAFCLRQGKAVAICNECANLHVLLPESWRSYKPLTAQSRSPAAISELQSLAAWLRDGSGPKPSR